MSYAEQIFLAEEIARGIKSEIRDAIVPEVKLPEPVITEEIRPKTPYIINHNLTVANRWYEIKIPINTVVWSITIRGNHEIQYSYSPTHQTFRTLRAGEVLEADTAPKDIEQSEYGSIFVMSTEGNVIVELEYWQK